jgi:hypothetical protein
LNNYLLFFTGLARYVLEEPARRIRFFSGKLFVAENFADHSYHETSGEHVHSIIYHNKAAFVVSMR